LVCYIRKYVIILGGGIFPLTSPPTKILGGCVPGIPGGVDASARRPGFDGKKMAKTVSKFVFFAVRETRRT